MPEQMSPTQTIDMLARRYGVERMTQGQSRANVVVMADEKYVFKVPRTDGPWAAWGAAALQREAQVLPFLDQHDFGPVRVPELVEYSEAPNYLVSTYVPGQTYNRQEVARMNVAERRRLGIGIAQYMVRQAGVLSPDEVADGLPPLGNRSWNAIFTETLGCFDDPRYPVLSEVTTEQYETWLTMRTAGREKPIATHGDLTPANVAFSPGHAVRGVLDWGRLGIGTLTSECSVLLSVDPMVAAACVVELALQGRHVDQQDMMIWHQSRQLHSLPYGIMHGTTEDAGYLYARDAVVARYPGRDWSELYQPLQQRE